MVKNKCARLLSFLINENRFLKVIFYGLGMAFYRRKY